MPGKSATRRGGPNREPPDVSSARISVDPRVVWNSAADAWRQLRRQAAIERPQEFIERLRSRKAQVGEGLAARRFEAAPGAPTPVSEAIAAAPTGPGSPPQLTPSKLAPETEPEPEDFASRLLRAKKKAMDERDRR